MWDDSAKVLSEGYVQAVTHLEAGACQEALDAYRTKYLATVKVIYSEASTSQPAKFDCIGDWGEWTRGLYVQSVQTEKALSAKPAKGSEEWTKTLAGLDAIRAHFAMLHKESDTETTGDHIFALRQECRKSAPDVGALKKTQAALDKAPASLAAADKPKEYAAAKAAWDKSLEPVLAKAPAEAKKESIETLRAAAEKLYRAFGMQLE